MGCGVGGNVPGPARGRSPIQPEITSMIVSHRFLAPFGVLVLVAFAVAQDAKTETNDWGKLIDPDKDCKLTAAGNTLTITVPKTWHDLTYQGDDTKRNAPRVLRPVNGDFKLQVKVEKFPLPKPDTSSNGKANFVSAGLLIWQDDKNFIRIERGSAGEAPFVWVEVFQDGQSAETKAHPLEDKDAWLRVTRSKDRLTVETSEDGKEWTEVHSTDVKLPAAIKAGALAINTTTKEFAPKLVDLTLTAK
jgi:regulation of enolase protein 1 (concanavalin A-like superfamily)